MGKKKTYVNQHSAFQLMLEKKKKTFKKEIIFIIEWCLAQSSASNQRDLLQFFYLISLNIKGLSDRFVYKPIVFLRVVSFK